MTYFSKQRRWCQTTGCCCGGLISAAESWREGLEGPGLTFLGSMLNFFFPFENSLLFSVILLQRSSTKVKTVIEGVCVCECVCTHFSSVNSKLRISAITLSISSFNFCMWTGESVFFSQTWALLATSCDCLPECHPEGLSYTAWCSPSPSFHRL